MTRDEILLHVITHGVGHRGRVSAVMLLNSVASAKDGFMTCLHEIEASAGGPPREPMLSEVRFTLNRVRIAPRGSALNGRH
jgi:hypothetical protein